MSIIYFRNDGELADRPVSDGHPLPVWIVRDAQSGGIDGRTYQVSAGTSATLIANANPYRRSIKVTNLTGSQIVYMGFDAYVSSTTGDYLHSAAGSSITTYAKNAIWCTAPAGAQTVTVMEETAVP